MTHSTCGTRATPAAIAGALLLTVISCGPPPQHEAMGTPVRLEGTAVAARDTALPATFDAAGVAAPLQQATLSTKVTGTVIAVLAQEGDVVAAGQPLVRIDARDLAARSAQVAASVAEAEAVRREALTQASRIRLLYADSAATRAQLDAVETTLARTEAGVRSARAAAGELGALHSYATVRAPFAGVVTRRFVDPGAFAAPGAPLVSVQDATQLRLVASAAPDVVRGVHRGQSLAATVEGQAVRARVEGVVPAASGNLYTINALVANPGRRLMAGSAATLVLPFGVRRALVIPTAAVRRDGELTGVTLRTRARDETRWVRLGREIGDVVEVSAGLHHGDTVVIPATRANSEASIAAAAPRPAGGR